MLWTTSVMLWKILSIGVAELVLSAIFPMLFELRNLLEQRVGITGLSRVYHLGSIFRIARIFIIQLHRAQLVTFA